MNIHDRLDKLINEFTQKYIDALSRLKNRGRRSYGFEYEFLPAQILTRDDVQSVAGLLAEIGFSLNCDGHQAENGLRVEFEPGGQIEYCSPPLFADDNITFDSLLSFIRQTNETIRKRLDIEYIGTDIMPGRTEAPLCLTADRYVKLHDRLARVDSRGLEMMKGTASIHLHVVISEFDEILPLFNLLCSLSSSDEFKMSRERKDIWLHTDTTRCGTPPCCFEQLDSSETLIRRLIHFALHAEVVGENVPFVNSSDLSFDAFLYHMTTLFTDIRFNLKGPTLELRTMDSMPLAQFRPRWQKFISLLERI
ncbi:MAG: glutamate-cysteine ligase family protein [Spirochaetales bacterium]|nr:glutamate-cysteine ligase family protein [Spirochaetales bacterium]